MSALVKALDISTPLQFGEKGHIEYTWSNSIQEKITQFHFQLTRLDKKIKSQLKIENILREILSELKTKQKLYDGEWLSYLCLLYRMIGQTRDIINGKGEYELGYIMIRVWYDFYPELAKFALKCFVKIDDDHPYGSWKDIKYFCLHLKKHNFEIKHPLIQYCITLINDQLKEDNENNSTKISLVSKWIPRERNGKFAWIYQELAINYFPEYLKTATNVTSFTKAILKCKTEYRKICSNLNKKLDTLQIKQAGKNWSNIDFNNVTSISLNKQNKAFMNKKGKSQIRYPYDKDRIVCASNFNIFIQKGLKGEVDIKGKRIGLNDFTKSALSLGNYSHLKKAERDLLNLQWKNNATLNSPLGNFIAMCDISGSMIGDPLHAAIALSIRVAEMSKLGKRVISFSVQPSWINLEKYDNFVDMVLAINNSGVGYHTDLYAAFKLILSQILQAKIPPEEVEDMVLAIFSDMQIDQCIDPCIKTKDNINNDKDVLYETVKKLYAEAGLKSVFGKPYNPPHILFWNLKSTSGFPTLSTQTNVSMMSGFSPSLLNVFCEKGLSELKSCTPWNILNTSLNHARYEILGNKINDFF